MTHVQRTECHRSDGILLLRLRYERTVASVLDTLSDSQINRPGQASCHAIRQPGTDARVGELVSELGGLTTTLGVSLQIDPSAPVEPSDDRSPGRELDCSLMGNLDPEASS